jgi:predicted ATP-dependent endonuclease of OLD family
MLLKTLKVENYRALRSVEVPLSRFGCLIGENNTGKSSILTALSLFLSGSQIAATDFFDPSQEVRIQVECTNISDDDLQRLEESHRTKITQIVHDGALTLVRVYGQDGKSRLKYLARVPRDPRFSEGAVEALVKNKRPGNAFRDEVVNVFPELGERATNTSNQTDVRGLISELAASLPDDQRETREKEIPTGFDKSIDALLPERIYIAGVKDLSDETKTREGSSFGRILKILLERIEPRLADINNLFEVLNKQLNRYQAADGTAKDERLEDIRAIEQTIERFVRETFAAVNLEIEIPPPEFKTILSSARISVDDGVPGFIETKGDGLKRAVVFSILRAYVEFSRPIRGGDEQRVRSPYLLLFEEPELYLHPKAQSILFDALRVFAKEHHVLVTTHSPAFFGPEAPATFIKLSKRSDSAVAAKPFAVAHPIDLREMTRKQQFHVICYENNNHAFFARTVVLAEGVTDAMVLRHLAQLLSQEWDAFRKPVAFAKVNGKSSIRTYRTFFNEFDVRTIVVADLDILLQDFDKLDPTPGVQNTRADLLNKINQIIQEMHHPPEPTGDRVRRLARRGEWRDQWRHVRDKHAQFQADPNLFAELNDAVEDFLGRADDDLRLNILQRADDPEVKRLKDRLRAQLFHHGVFVLERGCLEDYYPSTIQGDDKVQKALAFCNAVTGHAEAQALLQDKCTTLEGGRNEFEILFGHVFETHPLPVLTAQFGG